MVIRINGEKEAVGKPVNLAELVYDKGLVPDHIVVEYNMRIVPKDEWSGIRLQENDNIEIVSFVGGG